MDSARFSHDDAFVAGVRAIGEPGIQWLDELESTIELLEEQWGIECTHPFASTSGLVLAADRDSQPFAVLKLMHPQGDLFGRELAAHQAFEGSVARLLEVDISRGAMLIERVSPGETLSAFAHNDDQAALRVILGLAAECRRDIPSEPSSFPSLDVEMNSDCFDVCRPAVLEESMTSHAKTQFADLLTSAGKSWLLHGDLHHGNVLRSANHWKLIDPQGVFGEAEYEFAAPLRNPFQAMEEEADLFAFTQRRTKLIASELGLSEERLIRWTFARTVAALCEQADQGRELVPGWKRLSDALHRGLR